MGMTHILAVREDALSVNKEEPKPLESAIGKAVVTLCVDPKFAATGNAGLERVNRHGILNHSNGIEWAGEVHNTDDVLFVWTGNRVCSLDNLTKREVPSVKKLLEDALASLPD